MAKENSTRTGCKDVFRAFLVKNAAYEGELEIPCLKSEMQLPNKMISFSKSIGNKYHDMWVHFYEDDASFERLWNIPHKYLPILKRYRGIISPDFSLYRDMPLVMQQWNIYRSRALAHWLQENGVPVIPNVRFGDERTYETACLGIPKHSAIAVGSHGCIKVNREREYFKSGLDYVIDKIQPPAIVVYGAAPDSVFGEYQKQGINVLQFDSEFSQSRKAVNV